MVRRWDESQLHHPFLWFVAFQSSLYDKYSEDKNINHKTNGKHGKKKK